MSRLRLLWIALRMEMFRTSLADRLLVFGTKMESHVQQVADKLPVKSVSEEHATAIKLAETPSSYCMLPQCGPPNNGARQS